MAPTHSHLSSHHTRENPGDSLSLSHSELEQMQFNLSLWQRIFITLEEPNTRLTPLQLVSEHYAQQIGSTDLDHHDCFDFLEQYHLYCLH